MKKSNPKIFIHVGMAKALSTSLRNNLFQKIPNTLLLYGNFNYKNPIHKLIQFLSEAQEEYRSKISLNKVKKKKKFRTIKENILHFLKKNNKNIIISWPSFIGSMGGARDDFSNLIVNARLIKEIFGKNAKIIIIIRRQDNYCFSLFSTVVKRGFDLTFEEFLTLRKKNTLNKENKLSIRPIKIDYQKFYETYIKLFSKKNVLILPYEQFLFSKNVFERELSTFFEQKKIHKLDVHHNKSLSFVGINVMRKINSIINFLRFILNRFDMLFNLKLKLYFKHKNEKYKILRKFQKFLILIDRIFSIFINTKNKREILNVEKFKRKIIKECNNMNKKFDKKYKLNLRKYGYY